LKLPARVFYGWWVLAASVVIELFGLGFGIFAITTVYPYVVETFPDWSRATVFAPTSIVILTAGVMAPVTGAIIDRFPIRALFAVGIVVQSVALYLFGRVQTPSEYFGVSLLFGLGLSGVTILPNQVLVSRWFHDRIGLVNGIVLSATAMGAAISPALITRFIESLGGDWRGAFVWVALLAFGPPMLMVLFVVRDRPEAMGLAPYGAGRAAAGATSTGGLRLREAVRTVSFWGLAGTIFFAGIPCYSFNKHILVFLQELGWEPVAAADMKSLFFAVSSVARLSFGWLCDRFDKRRVVLGHLLCLAAGYPLILFVATHPALLLPCLVVVGIGYGGLLPTIPIMTVHLFGRAHLGKILGVYKWPYDVAAASAPLLTAWLYDVTGGYDVPERVNAALAWVGLAIAVLFLARRGRVAGAAPGSP
jgi:MFS family permease